MDVESRLPIVVVKGIIVFPGTVISLDVGKQKAINAIEAVINGERRLLLVTQRNDNKEESADNLFEHGTLTVVKQYMKLPNGVVRVLIEGVERVSLSNIQDAAINKPYFDANFETLAYMRVPSADEEVLRTMLIESFEQWAQLSKKVAQDVLKTLHEQTSPITVGDIIAANLTISLEEKEKILGEGDVKRRLIHLLHLLTEQLEYAKIRNNIEIETKTQIDKHQKEFYLREKIKAIHKELGDGEDVADEVVNYKKKAEAMPLPKPVADKVKDELRRLEKLPSASSESGVIRDYLDALLKLPWGKMDEENYEIEHAEKVLDRDHYGLEKVKERILEFLAVRILKKDGKAPIICFVGPPGVGKTSLAESIAEAIGRKFSRISLGGVRDEAEIRGHRRTYIGAIPGRIIHAMQDCECLNPLICLDEIDKLGSDSSKGDPSSALLEALDPAQNDEFSDHYIEFPFDLSKVFWIVTANTMETVPPALRDRMEVIELTSYTEDEKMEIAKQHLLPRQKENNGIGEDILTVNDKAMQKLIRDYTMESGVRNLERKLGDLCRKVAFKIVHGEIENAKITESNLEKFLGPATFLHDVKKVAGEVGIVNGLAWTSVGGELLKVEVLTYKGNGHLTLTGQLGDVMKESARAGLTYIRSCSKELGIKDTVFEKDDIHIHCPAGAIPKDGPSAGITMVTAMVSALTGRKTKDAIAMTGEVTLSGRVLPIGGVKEKVLAAHREGIKTVLMPEQNLQDLEKLPENVKEDMKFVGVKNVDEVLKLALNK